jgi:hypothetical protein
MDIFDEQAPFSEEQLEFLRTRFVSKNTAWNKLKADFQAENVSIPVGWAKQIQQRMSNAIASDFLKKLATEGGEIVSSSVCSSVEIALANKENRFFVDDESFGYVLRPVGWKPLPMDAKPSPLNQEDC